MDVHRESTSINKSLLFLGIVIAQLSKGERTLLSYRDSRLTRILQSSLGGNSRTAFICNVTPALAFIETTLSTLRLAQRAQRVQTNARVNEVESMMHLHADKIRELKEKLSAGLGRFWAPALKNAANKIGLKGKRPPAHLLMLPSGKNNKR